MSDHEISWLAPAVIVGTLVLFVALGIALVLVLGQLRLNWALVNPQALSLSQPGRRQSTSLGSCIRLRPRPEPSH